MCFERTDRAISIGRSPLCGGSLIICYMVFLTLMHPLEVITSFWYPNIIWGKKLLYSHFFPYLPRGEKWLYSHFPGGNLLYSHFSTYPAKGDIWLYSHFSGGKGYGGWGGNGSITPVRKISSSYERIKTKQVTVLLSNRKARKRYALILSELSVHRLYFSRFIWLINYQSSSIQQ